MSDVPRCKLCGCPDGPDYGDPHQCPPGFKVSPPPPTVLRVARSVDDLRVGQRIAWKWSDERPEDDWKIHTVHEKIQPDSDGKGCDGFWTADGGLLDAATFSASCPQIVVILSDAPDPPARDWLVPATQMEALGAALEYKGIWSVSPKDYEAFAAMRDAARAVLDAAREVEHE